MSFVERNKTWILPALAIGAAGVIWMNLRTFSEPPPPPTPQEPVAGIQPVPPAPPPAASDANLWEDLVPLAFVPAAVEARPGFEQRALTVLTRTDLDGTFVPAPMTRPSAEPGRPAMRPVGGDGTPARSAPHPEFVIEVPEGPRAWFAGRGYHQGQALQGEPFLIKGIHLDPAPLVVLKGSGGLSTRSTHPSPPSKESH